MNLLTPHLIPIHNFILSYFCSEKYFHAVQLKNLPPSKISADAIIFFFLQKSKEIRLKM